MRKSDDSSSPTSDDARHATDFMEFFVDKIDLIRETTNSVPPPIFTYYVGPTMETFEPTTQEQLTKMIAAAPNKHCVLDPAPTSLVKNCSSLLAPFLSKLFNRSLSESYVATSQKAAIITPLLMKMGLDKNDRKNYRPVSNLTFIPKLVERVVCSQMLTSWKTMMLFRLHRAHTGGIISRKVPCLMFSPTSVCLSVGNTSHCCVC